MHVVLQESIECWAPTTLGEANCFGFLWHKEKKGGWKRRYAVCCTSFIIFFSDKDAPPAGAPPMTFSAKPVGAICFEDLEVQPLNPHPPEKEVAAVCGHAFTVAPAEEMAYKFMSGATSRYASLCAESDREMTRWIKTLLMWRYAALCEDRTELIGTKDDLERVSVRMDEATKEAAEAKAVADRHEAAAEATHAQRLEVENELYSMRTQLADAQHAHARADAARTEAISDARKMRIFTALHKSARERLQSEMDVLKAKHESAIALNSPGSEGDGVEKASKQKSFKLGGKASKGGGVSFGGGGGGDVSERADGDEASGEGSSGSRRGVGFAGVLRKGSVKPKGTEARKGSTVNFQVPDDGADEGGDGMRSDVDEETAVNLLARAQVGAKPARAVVAPPFGGACLCACSFACTPNLSRSRSQPLSLPL